MPTAPLPVAGRWYQHLGKGQEFQVIDVDESGALVAMQHFDGDIEAIGLEDWYDLELEAIEPPEDCTGPMDDIEPGDLGYSDTAMDAADWDAPLEDLKADTGHTDEVTPDDAADAPPEAGVELVPYRE